MLIGNDDSFFGLPANLEEAVETFIAYYQNEHSFLELAYAPELIFLNRLHCGAGLFIRNTWYLEWKEGHSNASPPASMPPLVRYFNEIGIVHADDMSTIVISAVWHKLNDKPFDILYTVKIIQDYWKSQ